LKKKTKEVKNKWVNGTFLASFLLTLGIIYLPWISDIFRFVPLSFLEMGLITLIASSVLIAGEIYKRIKYKD